MNRHPRCNARLNGLKTLKGSTENTECAQNVDINGHKSVSMISSHIFLRSSLQEIFKSESSIPNYLGNSHFVDINMKQGQCAFCHFTAHNGIIMECSVLGTKRYCLLNPPRGSELQRLAAQASKNCCLKILERKEE